MDDALIDRRKAQDWLVELTNLLLATRFQDLAPSDQRVVHLAGLEGMTVSEGLWILSELERALMVPGDICEFGVAGGATTTLMAHELMLNGSNDRVTMDGRRLWLFDSFRGLPAPAPEDELIDDIFDLGSMAAYQGTMQADSAVVRHRLSSIGFPVDRTVVVEGFIEATITREDLPQAICFALVDFDFYQPIRVALDYLRRHLVRGGAIVVDDYGHFSAGAKKAVDEFVESYPAEFTLTVAPQWAGYFAVLHRRAGESGGH